MADAQPRFWQRDEFKREPLEHPGAPSSHSGQLPPETTC
jgi:hypothetical protein